MDTWSLPKARPISCNDCPAFQRLHMSVRCVTESFTRLRCVINTTFRKKIYNRWCCIDRLSWHLLPETGFSTDSHIPITPFIRSWPPATIGGAAPDYAVPWNKALGPFLIDENPAY